MPVVVHAQSDFDLSQRFFNEAIYNPAATGNTFTTGFYLQLRKQWAGLDGAPTTEVFSVDTYLERFLSGIGFSITGDQIGFTNTYTARAAYSFFIPISDKAILSLGASAGLINRNKNANGALVDDLNDGELYFGNVSEFSPDFDFGFEFHGFMKLGASIRHLGRQSSRNTFPDNSKNIWAYVSTRFNIIHDLSFEPTASYMRRNGINRYEVGGIFYFKKSSVPRFYNDRFWLGGMYRFNDQYSILAGFHITPKLRIGYSFDYGMRELSIISKGGTHEIFIAWQFNRIFYKDRQMECPAYRNTEYDTKEKKDRLEKLYYQFY
jgi:type IX secretion system PorP/SprF family membrane protein